MVKASDTVPPPCSNPSIFDPRTLEIMIITPTEGTAVPFSKAFNRASFMPVSLLDSQFATLEALQPDEVGIAVDISQEIDAVVHEITQRLAAQAR